MATKFAENLYPGQLRVPHVGGDSPGLYFARQSFFVRHWFIALKRAVAVLMLQLQLSAIIGSDHRMSIRRPKGGLRPLVHDQTAGYPLYGLFL